ncbi:hypothetical protein DFP72DRAFT_416864 [Ephemerocybe angulata]|uniref:Phytocyanin domain-containing protein n=1 Tax=Ephemerocybe angulata TaxID=980116 RepID=A0A8H6IGW3_9AGAR|nr:hypothetical protein DFP72DRAFT_416864 [Tulosesus angulatus]
MQLSWALASLLLPIAAYAADFPVAVGKDGFTFEPSNIAAAKGDVIIFSFYPKNHTVSRSTFDKPCQTKGDDKKDDSSYVPVSSASTPTVWTWTVDGTDPAWFYCAQTSPVNHCQQGMVFAVNPNEKNTFAAFQAAAKSAGTATSTSTAPSGSSTSNSGKNGASSLVASARAVLLAVAGTAVGFVLV